MPDVYKRQGIDSCLKIMDVVVSRQIVYHDVWCGEGNMYGQIQGLPARFEGNATSVSYTHLYPDFSKELGVVVFGNQAEQYASLFTFPIYPMN